MTTHKQDVVEAKKEIEPLKARHTLIISEIGRAIDKGELKQSDLQRLQLSGNKYFNYVENFVGDSDLLGAHTNVEWVRSFAEDCRSHLETMAHHFALVNLVADLTSSALAPPSPNAYAGMQRMVKKYLTKKDVADLRPKLVASGVPTSGLDQALPMEKIKISDAKPSLLAVALLLLAFAYSFFVPYPSGFQAYVVRTLISLAGALFVVNIPGFIEITLGTPALGTMVKAGGALAVLVLLYAINPAKIDENKPVKVNSSTVENDRSHISDHRKPEAFQSNTKPPIDVNPAKAFPHPRKKSPASLVPPVVKLPVTVMMASDSAMLIPEQMIHGFRATKATAGGNAHFDTEQNKTVFLQEGEKATVTLGSVNYTVVLGFTAEGTPTLTVDK